MVDYIKIIKRPFSDIKILTISILVIFILGLVSIVISILNLFLMGLENIIYLPFYMRIIDSVIVYIIQLLISAPILGYVLYSSKTILKKDFKLIPWGNWKNLFKKGISGYLIFYIYYIPFMIVNFILMKLFGFMDYYNLSYSNNPNLILSSLPPFSSILLYGLIILVMILIFTYFVSMAHMMYINKFIFFDAFKLKKLFRNVMDIRWLKAWIMSILISIGILIISLLIIALFFIAGISIPIFLILVIPFGIILFYLSLFSVLIITYTIYAQAYSEIKIGGKNEK